MTPDSELFLRPGADRRLRGGHLWIYSNEVDTGKTPLSRFGAGEQLLVRNARGDLLGSAYMDPHSLICARLYAPAEVRAFDAAFCIERISSALAGRERAFPGPWYRLVYGDSDGLPGVVVDRFGPYLVLQLNNAGAEAYRQPVVEALLAVLEPRGVLLRGDSRERRDSGLSGGSELVFGEVPEAVELEENGVRFQAPLHHGQKTGWFYDHRMARARLAPWVGGKSVLDVYSYIGGWGIQAAAFGAASVCAVDSSAMALEGVLANAALNKLGDRVSVRRGEAAETLKALLDEGLRYGVVVVDPPAFIQRRKDSKKGQAAYRKIFELGLRLLEPGGLLVAASCSMHLSRPDLLSVLQQAASRAGIRSQVVEQGGQGPDHPVHPAIPETEYLKSVFLRRL